MQRTASGPVRLRALLGLAAILLTQLPWVSPTNFGGFDEWVILELNSRGVVSVPYAHRPLGLIWSLPGSLLAARFGFAAFTPLYAAYALLSAGVVLWLVRRLQPEHPSLALLTGCFLLVWAPGDLARLSSVDRAVYQGIAFGTLLAAALLVEAWLRQSLPLLALSVLMAFVAARCYEGGAALLLGVPALLLLTQRRCRRLWLWILAWEAVVALALASFLLEMLLSPQQQTYQLSVLGLERNPGSWLGAMAWQYAFHLFPLATTPRSELLAPAVPAAVCVFLLVLVLLGASPEPEPRGSRPFAVGIVLGLVLAGLGYSLVVLGIAFPTAFRLQFLSGPGIAFALASAVLLAASPLSGRARAVATGLLGAWIVAAGTARTVAMQHGWDHNSFHARQMGMLSGLVRELPDVQPHSLIVLLDEGGAWRASFSFHHAVQYLYARRAAGYVPGRWDPLYPVASDAEGLRFEPWPIIRGAWDVPRTLYRCAELVAVRYTASGEVVLEDTWPQALPPLPEGCAYAPRGRLNGGAQARRAVLAP